ncbi:MAG: universal stress protein [Halothiobacillaceae bacterium]|jgi:Universal stress protein UspA and related nucleotide-binding proteins|nr:universal stress protein [Halothiobacillaceae bacterium]
MFQTIVFAYDGSAECQDALEEGIALSSRFNARCHLLAVVPPLSPYFLAAGPLPEDLSEKDRAYISAILEIGLARLREAGLDATGSIRIWEAPAEAIGDFVREVGADLVIVGHHRRSALDRWWRGSVGHSLLDKLPCSLFVSMPRETPHAPRDHAADR